MADQENISFPQEAYDLIILAFESWKRRQLALTNSEVAKLEAQLTVARMAARQGSNPDEVVRLESSLKSNNSLKESVERFSLQRWVIQMLRSAIQEGEKERVSLILESQEAHQIIKDIEREEEEKGRELEKRIAETFDTLEKAKP